MNRNFVEAIASNMLVKQVNTYEKAVRYIRDQSKVKGKGAASASSGTGTPGIPPAFVYQERRPVGQAGNSDCA